jgi:short-subunit dehydrogenase
VKPWKYRDRWALVTGASAGLGWVFAERLAERGMNLVLSSRRTERLDKLGTQLTRDYGIQTVAIGADLTRRGAAAELWRAATNGRAIDLLVNNAGFGAKGVFDDVPLDRHVGIMEVNCLALMELAHLALADMRTRGDGGIINVASIAAFQPVPLLATYAASKAFVLSLSEALWLENRQRGIRVLALCPGRTPTEFQQIAGTGTADGAFGYRTPLQVVDSGLEAFERNRSYKVPGVENLAATWLARVAPHGIVTRTMKRMIRGLWEKG